MGKEKRKETHSVLSRQGYQEFLQPLAVALVSIVFISLVLVMGLVDLKNIDNTHVNHMENRGLDIISNAQQVVENNFQQLVQSQQNGLYAEIFPGLTESAFSLKESLVLRLVELGRRIDSQFESGKLRDDQLASMADKENLWHIVFLDEQGNVTAKNRTVPEEIVRFAAPVQNGREEIQINIFDQFKNEEGLGLIALPLKSRKGTLIMTLDNTGFLYWSLKVSIQRAIDEVGQGPGISHFIVMDQYGGILGRSGTEVEPREEAPTVEGEADNRRGVASRKTIAGGEHVLEIAAPVAFSAGFSGTARIGLSRERIEQLLKKEQTRVLIYMAFLVIITLLAMWLLYKNQKRHLSKMQDIERQLHKAERLSALGRLAAGVAHEIRNPLNAISMASQRLERNQPDKLTGVIREEITSLNRIIEEFLLFAKSRKLEFGRHDLTEIIGKIVLLIKEEADSRGVKILNSGDGSPLMVFADFDKLKQALFNIVKNAMESISGEGSVTLSAEAGKKGWVNLKITDTGCGLTAEETEQIFDPDYTTKEKGLGLGLPLAHEIIRGHGGEIKVWSEKGSGTTFEILLPASGKGER